MRLATRRFNAVDALALMRSHVTCSRHSGTKSASSNVLGVSKPVEFLLDNHLA
jgi:hypothetical protein